MANRPPPFLGDAGAGEIEAQAFDLGPPEVSPGPRPESGNCNRPSVSGIRGLDGLMAPGRSQNGARRSLARTSAAMARRDTLRVGRATSRSRMVPSRHVPGASRATAVLLILPNPDCPWWSPYPHPGRLTYSIWPNWLAVRAADVELCKTSAKQPQRAPNCSALGRRWRQIARPALH